MPVIAARARHRDEGRRTRRSGGSSLSLSLHGEACSRPACRSRRRGGSSLRRVCDLPSPRREAQAPKVDPQLAHCSAACLLRSSDRTCMAPTSVSTAVIQLSSAVDEWSRAAGLVVFVEGRAARKRLRDRSPEPHAYSCSPYPARGSRARAVACACVSV